MNDPAGTASREGEFETRSECAEAILELIGSTRRELLILAPTLEPEFLARIEVIEAVKHLALGGRGVSVRMLAQNDARLGGHRALPLIQRLSSRITVNRQDEDVEFQPQVIWIGDGRLFLHRKQEARHEGHLDLSNPAKARRHRTAFEHLWIRSRADPETRRLMI